MRTFHTGGVAGDDITQGLPRVEELFEARKPKRNAIIAENEGTVRVVPNEGKKGTNTIFITGEDGIELDYLIPYGSRIIVKDGDVVSLGARLTEGSINPHDIMRVMGTEATQRYLVYEVQKVYKSQGVEINDKHIEVIVRQMLHKVKIETAGDADMLPGIWWTLIPLTKKTVVLPSMVVKMLQANVRYWGLRKPLWQRTLSCLLRPSKKQHVFLPTLLSRVKSIHY